jgi:hypothetical protein
MRAAADEKRRRAFQLLRARRGGAERPADGHRVRSRIPLGRQGGLSHAGPYDQGFVAGRNKSAPPALGCGSTRRYADSGDYETDPYGRAICPSCSWHLDRRFMSPDGHRDYAANRLTSATNKRAPLGLGS